MNGPIPTHMPNTKWPQGLRKRADLRLRGGHNGDRNRVEEELEEKLKHCMPFSKNENTVYLINLLCLLKTTLSASTTQKTKSCFPASFHTVDKLLQPVTAHSQGAGRCCRIKAQATELWRNGSVLKAALPEDQCPRSASPWWLTTAF